MNGRASVDGDKVANLLSILNSNLCIAQYDFEAKLFDAMLADKVRDPRKEMVLAFYEMWRLINALLMNKAKTNCASKQLLIGIGLLDRHGTGLAEVSCIAVLATPNFSEAFCCDAYLMKGSKTFIATVEFSFAVALEAMVIIKFVFIHVFFLLEDAFFGGMLAARVCRYSYFG
jgi:hypothetical protein